MSTKVTAAWVIDSPVGRLLLESDGESLTRIHFLDADEPPTRDGEAVPVLADTRDQLLAYFAGERHTFDLPLAPAGTDFQRLVWRELEQIPYATTTSYGEIAARLGMPPGGSRAVGLANGSNPIPIVVPCHRVIGANGNLTGYGGGLDRKRFLLDLEQATAGQGTLFD